MNVEDVKRFRNELVSDDPTLTPAQITMGLRTRVHEQLQLEKPPPYTLPPPDADKTPFAYMERIQKADKREQARLHKESKDHKAAREQMMRAAVSVEDYEAFEAWKASGEGQKHEASCLGQGPGLIPRDAHHFAQYQHNKKLWAEADQLVSTSGVQ
jgi:hypothetical protein